MLESEKCYWEKKSTEDGQEMGGSIAILRKVFEYIIYFLLKS